MAGLATVYNYLAGIKWLSAHLLRSQNFFLVWLGQAFRTQIARITASQDESSTGWQQPHTKLCLAHAALVNTCESAHYLIKQNNNHGSIGSSPGLFIMEMLPGAIMTLMLLCLKHAKSNWILRFRQAHEYRFQAVFNFFFFLESSVCIVASRIVALITSEHWFQLRVVILNYPYSYFFHVPRNIKCNTWLIWVS